MLRVARKCPPPERIVGDGPLPVVYWRPKIQSTQADMAENNNDLNEAVSA